jgi:hypothetical protein
LAEASYQDWLTYIFDREATEDGEAWYWNEPAAIELSPQLAARYTTQAFGAAARTLGRYSDAQIARGLDYITNTMVSDHGHFLHNGEVPQDERIDAIRSMTALGIGRAPIPCLRPAPSMGFSPPTPSCGPSSGPTPSPPAPAASNRLAAPLRSPRGWRQIISNTSDPPLPA